MDAALLEQLLHEDESSTLDFKRDQYKFDSGSDMDRSELLKDILGFANGWRRADAYILIGVEEVRGGRSKVKGTTEHLDDHTLQQFVNSRTNKPIRFSYEVFPVDGVKIGVIRIEQQSRPFYLSKDYGKLKRSEVYVRRGSSTDPTKPATPEEIIQMGVAAEASVPEAELIVEFADPEQEHVLGNQIECSAEFCQMPEASQIPKNDDGPRSIQLPGGGSFSIPKPVSIGIHDRPNSRFYHQTAEFEFIRRLCRPIRLVVTNSGSSSASEVRVEALIPHGSGFGIMDESDIPNAPRERESIAFSTGIENLKFRPPFRQPGYVYIETNDHHTKMEIDCGNLQPGRKVWTDAFYIGIPESGEIQFKGSVYAANLVKPKEFVLAIKANVTKTSMTVEQLIELADGKGDDD